jgi:hypothetical protein
MAEAAAHTRPAPPELRSTFVARNTTYAGSQLCLQASDDRFKAKNAQIAGQLGIRCVRYPTALIDDAA